MRTGRQTGGAQRRAKRARQEEDKTPEEQPNQQQSHQSTLDPPQEAHPQTGAQEIAHAGPGTTAGGGLDALVKGAEDARRVHREPSRVRWAGRRKHEDLLAHEKFPLGNASHPTWKLPEGPSFGGPADDCRLRQGREARHWLIRTNAKTGVAMGLLTSGEFHKRPEDWEPTGTAEDPSYVWPNVRYHQLQRTRVNSNASRTKKRKERRDSRDPDTHCTGRQFMCEADTSVVIGKAQAWRSQHPTDTLQLPTLIPMVLDVIQQRTKEERSNKANALVEAAERRDVGVLATGKTAEGKPLLGEGFLARVRRACPKVWL